MSGFWSIYVIVLVLVTVIGSLWLLQGLSKKRVEDEGEVGTTKHVWDKDLVEYDNPLPRWWLILFWLTVLYSVGYLVVYPGMGSFAGIWGWTQTGQYERELARAEKRYGDIFAAFSGIALTDLAEDPEAVQLGRNLFQNNCATCHGSDARGARGFPNLTDDAWLYGGEPEKIEATITNGRNGVMPALGAAMTEEELNDVVAHVLSLSGRGEPNAKGQEKFGQMCIACHGVDAKGNQLFGAPDLTDDDWLHGSAEADIRDVILNGRSNHMPAQKEALSPDRIRTLVAYVLSLSKS